MANLLLWFPGQPDIDTCGHIQCLCEAWLRTIYLRRFAGIRAIYQLAMCRQLRICLNAVGLESPVPCSDSAYAQLQHDQQQDDCLQFHKHGDGSHVFQFASFHDLPICPRLDKRSHPRMLYCDVGLFTRGRCLHDFCLLHNLLDHHVPRYKLLNHQKQIS